MELNITFVAVIIGGIWLIVLTVLFFRLSSHYNNLVRGSKNKTLKSILEQLLAEVHLSKKDIDSLRIRCDKIEKDNSFHIQKIGLLRFNPFKDTGGDQSFILVFVDANNTGIVLSGLYARSGTRWYAKRVVRGEGIEHELSEEEKKAIKDAKIAV
jgi:hypothetical protein